ncbi:putative late blight resistance protein homolog R1A-10 [Salvia splendens]|uniref:putative late blight resistance protein homolog R1A-10 n=1 Tax=Salvia splendens TaxID=180675 RepID=UPI001C251748|nr:putative late blight resistance protein homolog R1A-10 [Salvia splendens]
MAYAALISLKHTIQRFTDLPITKSPYEELILLESTLRKLDDNCNSNINRRAINELDAQIRDAACKLEVALESYHSDSVEARLQIPLVDLKGVEQEILSFVKSAKNLGDNYNRVLDIPLPIEEEDNAVLPKEDVDCKESTTVYLSDQLEKIIIEFLDLQSRLKIVSIFGMAGIGKTHLASKIYEDGRITGEYDVRVWASIGPKFYIKKILADIAAQVIGNNPRNVYMEEDKNTLADLVYKKLSGQRYFIVLDDIWSTGAWDHLKSLFPIEQNGSRILLTTRLEEVAKYPTSSSNVYQLRFLNNEESWELLWKNVFDNGCFPDELEEAGRKIAENCEGLPLLILAVARILRGHDKTEQFWNEVVNKKTPVFLDAYDSISKQLLLSYEYLPQYLKACFLYIAVFPQYFKVHVAKLINLWAVEDFIEPSQNLEDFAKECLKRLVSLSLIIICSQSISYGIKSCKLHSAYWHVAVKEARKTMFFHVLNKGEDGNHVENHRRLCVQNNILFAIKEVCGSMAATWKTRSLLCTGEDHQYQVPVCLNLMLLKVLDALTIRYYEFPTEVLKLIELRYLALTVHGELPPFLSNLQNIQNLIVRRYHNIKVLTNSSRFPEEKDSVQEHQSIQPSRNFTGLPMEIWDMQELRHLWIMGSKLPDPSDGAKLQNLLTFHADAHCCTKDVFRGISKLKKLRMKIELEPDAVETLNCLEHISILDELESLKCVVANPQLRSQVELSYLPQCLKKLSLNGLGYCWESMSVIGSLPQLEVLKVQCSAFQGPEWKTKVEEFPRLEFLLLEDIDLVHWRTDDDDEWLPCLQRLIIRNCYKLKVIPSQVGYIDVLKTIEVVDCSPSLVASALQIKEKEEEYGNFYLQVMISSSWKL